MSLFRSDEGALHPTEYLSNLLWSLEMLARSPDYLMRSALLLARLHQVDPGGRLGNRPFASLRQIFVTWSPQTYAKPAQRLKVIDQIVAKYPSVGWKLLLALAPQFYDTSEPSSMPNWRDFTLDEPEAMTWPSLAAAARATGQRLLTEVGVDGERWRALLRLWPNFSADWRAAAAKQLKAYAGGLNDPAEIEAMRETLRTFLQNHRGHRGAEWAMAEKDLKPLDKIFDVLKPTGVEDRVRWLFRPGAVELRPDFDWNKQQAELEALHTEAAEDLMAELSSDQLFAFASTITMQGPLGAAIARTSAPNTAKHDLMKRGLLADANVAADVGLGILSALKLQAGGDGDDWVRALWRQAIVENWGERAEVRIVQNLPPTSTTWAEIAMRSSDLAAAYWRTLSAYRIPGDADPTYAVDHLLAVGRSRGAVGWLGHNIKIKPNGALVIRAMRAAAKSDEPAEGNDATMLQHWVSILLNYLETDSEVTEQDVVGLEWIYFQVLRYSQRPPRTLHRALARDPEFFAYLLKLIYLPAVDSGVVEPKVEDEANAQNLASQAFQVLRDWAYVPGSDDQGVIDPLALEDWMKRARKLLAEAGRGEIGDSKIGEILSAAIREPDQPWPPKPVRELIELARSRPLEQGFEVGVYNRRGVTVRMPQDGGGQERALAERYRHDAKALRFDWPRTAACLDRIATTYEVDASRQDLSAEQRDWL